MKPKKWEDLTRQEKIKGILALLVIGFFAFVLLSPSKDKKPSEQPTSQEEIVNNTTLTTEQKIEKVVKDVLKGRNNNDKEYFKNIAISGDEESGFVVDVDFNAGDNLSTGLRKSGIEKTMSEIYAALYSTPLNVDMVRVSAFFPLVDKYGNESDGLVYKSVLTKEEAVKVNWEASETTLEQEILPGPWTTTFLHPEFR